MCGFVECPINTIKKELESERTIWLDDTQWYDLTWMLTRWRHGWQGSESVLQPASNGWFTPSTTIKQGQKSRVTGYEIVHRRQFKYSPHKLAPKQIFSSLIPSRESRIHGHNHQCCTNWLSVRLESLLTVNLATYGHAMILVSSGFSRSPWKEFGWYIFYLRLEVPSYQKTGTDSATALWASFFFLHNTQFVSWDEYFQCT